MADAVAGQRGQPRGIEAVLADHLERPERAQLGDLLGPCHPPQEVRGAGVERERAGSRYAAITVLIP